MGRTVSTNRLTNRILLDGKPALEVLNVLFPLRPLGDELLGDG